MLTVNRHAPRRIVACFALAVLASCGGRTWGDFVSEVTSFRGLWTSPNDLPPPKGSLAVATNTAKYRSGILSPRRGEAWLSYDSVGGTIDAITDFQGYTVVHYGTTIKYWTGAAWSAYSGSFAPRSGKPARFYESAGSLFFLSSAGVYELDSITGTWRLTGSPPGLAGTAVIRRTTSETGFATTNGQWAYRVVWGRNNANKRLQLGAPSGRFVMTAPANVVAAHANIAKLNTASLVTVTGTTHGFVTGEYVDVTLGGAETWFAAGRFQVTRVSDTSFTYSDALTNSSGSTQNPAADITYGFTSRNATLTIPIPSDITTTDFLQVYRSAKSADANSTPSDNMAMVYEKAPTNLEITAASMTVTDITPDDVRQPALYTSLGERPYARPPTCADAAEFRGGTLYACTAQLQSTDATLISASSLVINDALVFVDSPDAQSTTTFRRIIYATATEDPAGPQFKVYSDGSVSQNIANTAKSLVRVINAQSTANLPIYAEYASSDTEAPGRIRLYARSPSVGRFTFHVDLSSASKATAAAFIPALAYSTTVTDLTRVGSTVTLTASIDHGLAVGQQFTLDRSSNTTAFPNGVKTVATVPTGATLTYTETGSATSGVTGFLYSAPLGNFTSANSDFANGLMWSLPDQPWAVPSVNFKFVGPSGSTQLSLVSTRDRVLIYTDKGLYQGTGDGENWTFTEYDVTINLQAPRTAIAAAGKAYGWFEGGFAEMTEAARVVSGPIDKTLRDLIASAQSTVASTAFAVGYESQNMVLLFTPNANGDTAAKSVYVLHTDTGDWTGPWDLNSTGNAGPIAGAGMVSPADDKLYLASGGLVAKELKSLTATDQVEALRPGVLTDIVFHEPVGNVVAMLAGTISDLGSLLIGAKLFDSTSSAESTITAVDSTAKTVTLVSATGFDSGDTVTLVTGPITAVIQPIAITEGEPGAQKVFREGNLQFRDSEFTSGSLTFATDLSPSFSAATTLTPPGGSSANPTEIDFWVPESWRRGTRLSMKFSHGAVGETFALQGFKVTGRIASPRTSR